MATIAMETARAYAEELGGEGERSYLLMCLISLQVAGLTIFPTHRLVKRGGPEVSAALKAALRGHFSIEEVPVEQIAPRAPGEGPLELGYINTPKAGR